MESGAGIRSGGTKSEEEQGQDRKGGSSSQPCDEAEEARTITEGRKDLMTEEKQAWLGMNRRFRTTKYLELKYI